MPRCCQSHVYIFFITGFDPLDCANVSGVADYCRSLGYNATYLGQRWHAGRFEDEIHRIYHDDSDARFVLVGFSFGANSVRAIAEHLHEDGDIPVELMVYLGANTIEDDDGCKPANVKKLVHILASTRSWNGHSLSEAENHVVAGVRHSGTPTSDQSLGTLVGELGQIAASVPFAEFAPPAEELRVTPRPVTPPPPSPADEWDFLRPVTQLPSLDR